VKEEINDDATIRVITEEEEIDETKDLNDKTEKIISYAEGTATLNVVFHYIEQQPDVVPNNILFVKSLRDNETRKDFQLKNKKQLQIIYFNQLIVLLFKIHFYIFKSACSSFFAI